MSKRIRIVIEGDLPETDDKHLGHKAVVAVETEVAAVVGKLGTLGIEATEDRSIVSPKKLKG